MRWTGRSCATSSDLRSIAKRQHEIDTLGNHAVLSSAADPDRSGTAWLKRRASPRSPCSPSDNRSTCTRTWAHRPTSRGATGSRRSARVAPRGSHPHGDGVGRHAGATPILSPPAAISVWCTTARCPIRIWCASGSSRWESSSRRTTTPRPHAASSSGACARAMISQTAVEARLQRAGWLLHVPHGHRSGAADRARRLCLQARGGGGDRRLRGDRLGVPLAVAPAGHRATRRCSSRSRRRFTHGEFEARAQSSREFDLGTEIRCGISIYFLHQAGGWQRASSASATSKTPMARIRWPADWMPSSRSRSTATSATTSPA